MEKILAETDSLYHLMDSPKRFIVPEDIVLLTGEITLLKEVKSKILANKIIWNAKNLFKF